MRLPFPPKEQSYGSMTPLKQVVAVKRKEEAPKSSTAAGTLEEGAPAGAAASAEGGAVEEVASKMDGLSVDAAVSA